MVLETERLILRQWEKTDAESLYKYAKDERVGPMAGWPVHKSVEESREIIETVLSDKETYAVVLKETGEAAGCVGVMIAEESDKTQTSRQAEIGYWIGVPFWGKGLIPEAVKTIVSHVFLDLNITTLWCGYYDGNEKSKKAMEKCGFKYHHTLFEKECPLIDEVRTEHVARLTKKEWEKQINR